VKKIFSKEMALIYNRLLGLSLAGFGIAVAMVIWLHNSGLPVDAMFISSIPRLMFFASMICGTMVVMSYWKMNVPVSAALAIVLVVAGILLTAVFNFFSNASLDIVGYGRNETVVVESSWKRDYKLGYGVAVVESICISNGYLVDVYNVTKIYEQDGTSQQKRRVGLDALQPGQVVDITSSSFGDDEEFYNLLIEKFPPYGLDYTIWHGAAEITIRKGEYGSIDSRYDMCKTLFGK
jgi:hypothetical protein